MQDGLLGCLSLLLWWPKYDTADWISKQERNNWFPLFLWFWTWKNFICYHHIIWIYILQKFLIRSLCTRSIQKTPLKLDDIFPLYLPEMHLENLVIYITFSERKRRPKDLSAQPNHFQMRNLGSGRLSGQPRLAQTIGDKSWTGNEYSKNSRDLSFLPGLAWVLN